MVALLLAACMAAAVSSSAGTSAIFNICAVTNFKETCQKSLAGATGTQPKDLIKTALDAAAVELHSAVESAATYRTASADEMAQGALMVCEEMLNTAIDDLRRSSDKVDKIEMGRLSYNIAAVRNWLSAAVTHKENCIDELETTAGEIGEKVKGMLETSSELLSNGLAMIANTEPKLLGEEIPPSDADEVPSPAAVAQKLTVAQDGSGQFTTINDALKSLPQMSDAPVVVLVKAGVYKEYVVVPKGMNNVALIGDGPLATVISGSRSNATGYRTSDSATLTIRGEGFLAKDIGIENTAPTTQAVAVLTAGDKAVFHNVHIDSLQDSLYANSYRQFYRDCRISGTIDFIFGDAIAVLQNCEIVVRKPLPKQYCTITAQGRTEKTGDGVTVIQGGNITAEEAFLNAQPPVQAYLGRPWKQYSRTIIMQADIGGFIQPQGWAPWNASNFALDTLFYGEWANKGAGSDLSNRVKWKGIQNMTLEIAESFTAGKLFVDDEWVKNTGVPYVAGMLPTA
ncbi:pectinesterase-like [Salvia miltiorrhiza]|uniref:pectinesterase-like n=1 Tax=Salvia miltiorrhiza TaxID=226208 RepID=UPI0025AD8047|nr:pectinesterase-like [Salvia miltiorrhiza]XP_057785645.1 pectinesterase-like [Salvia miltiorrhiza]